MKLIDLISIVDENYKVEVYDLNGHKIAEYNGKDGIDEKYNNSEVEKVEVVRFLGVVRIVINRIVITSNRMINCWGN